MALNPVGMKAQPLCLCASAAGLLIVWLACVVGVVLNRSCWWTIAVLLGRLQLVDDARQVAVLKPTTTSASRTKLSRQGMAGSATSAAYDVLDEAAVQDAWGVPPSQVWRKS
jgi:hypothetical protein